MKVNATRNVLVTVTTNDFHKGGYYCFDPDTAGFATESTLITVNRFQE